MSNDLCHSFPKSPLCDFLIGVDKGDHAEAISKEAFERAGGQAAIETEESAALFHHILHSLQDCKIPFYIVCYVFQFLKSLLNLKRSILFF